MYIISVRDKYERMEKQTEYLKHLYIRIHTVITNIKRNDCRLLRSGISISKKEQRRKLFSINLVTTVVHI